MNKNTYLFTLTITPVQSFISQARKTKDLFVGSEILSSLIREALKEFEKFGIKIIPQDNKFLSNKFVGKLKNKTKQNVEDLGNKLENLINKEFIKKIFKETCKYDSAFLNFFKVFWVAVELEDDYKKSYKKLEQNLGAIKNLRTFTQQEQESGRKCSLCGERNIVQEDKYRKEEKLCLICLTKRECEIEGKSKEDYPSTAKITLFDWLENTNIEQVQKYRKIFSENEFDEELFFKDNLTESYFKKNNIKINKLQKAKLFLNTLDTSTQKKYYALIQFDIDDMGKKLSSLDEEGQKKLSKALAEFGEKAKSIVDKSGETIYAGGDDFLGFVNLKYLFTTIKCIKRAFKRYVISKFPNLTFSTSIVIAHYKAPLHKILDFSRELLAETKAHFDNKNGVGIVVLSDSAINAKTICRYENLELLKEMKEQKVGMSLHYKLKQTFNFLDDTPINYREYENNIMMLEYEIKRLLKREDKNFNESLYVKLANFLGNQVTNLDTEKNIKIDFDNFIGYLKTLEQLRKVL